MTNDFSTDLKNYGLIAALIGGAYLVWQYVYASPTKKCPTGQHAVNPCDNQIGLPAQLCNFGRNLTGAALDCKADIAITCDPGYNLVDGVCVAIGPGGCNVMAETCNQPPPAGRYYLDETTCTCKEKNYTDECILGANECLSVPLTEGGWGKRVLDCIFVPVLGNRWQVRSPMEACGGDALPVVTPVNPSDTALKACEDACGPNDGTLKWANCHLQCEGLPEIPAPPATNIVKCSCGLIDLMNPPGTTCESACKTAPTLMPIPVETIQQINARCGLRFSAFGMSKSACLAQCSGSGCRLDQYGRCNNAAERCFQIATNPAGGQNYG